MSERANGFVYFVEADAPRLVKIGLAKDPAKRMADLQTASPARLRLAATISTDDPRQLEGWLHERFAHLRSHREWFKLDRDLRRLIKALPQWPITVEWRQRPITELPAVAAPPIAGRDYLECAKPMWTFANVLRYPGWYEEADAA